LVIRIHHESQNDSETEFILQKRAMSDQITPIPKGKADDVPVHIESVEGNEQATIVPPSVEKEIQPIPAEQEKPMKKPMKPKKKEEKPKKKEEKPKKEEHRMTERRRQALEKARKTREANRKKKAEETFELQRARFVKESGIDDLRMEISKLKEMVQKQRGPTAQVRIPPFKTIKPQPRRSLGGLQRTYSSF
jgi:hypothetical protein